MKWFLLLTMLATAILRAQPASAPLTVRPRVAIVGLVHSHVWGHLQRMSELLEADFVGIAEPNPELVAEAKKRAPRVEYFDDYKRMIEAKKPHMVWAFVENNRHLEIVEYCAPRKIHVIFEKPLASNYADAKKIRDLARQHGIQVMTNYQMVWWPSQYAAKAEADKGTIGQVWRLHGVVGHGGPGSEGVTNKFFFQWLTDPVGNGAGALVDFGCYNALWSLWYLGRPQSVYAQVNHIQPQRFPKVEDNAVLVLSYKNGVGIFEGSWDLPRGFQDLEIFGRSGSLYLTSNRVETRKGRESADLPLPALADDRREPISYMIGRLRAGQPVDGLVALDINVEVNEIIEAALESVKTGRAVSLP
ncbi:MAG: Gfo/Idh/MocA family oxidoreductase [Acidobacteria bacterium]|nr:Gfo/Idh/MocA family oxidoreductase [Acidobacteriota bacterium]